MIVKASSRRLRLPRRLSAWALAAADLPIIGLSLLFIYIGLWHFFKHRDLESPGGASRVGPMVALRYESRRMPSTILPT